MSRKLIGAFITGWLLVLLTAPVTPGHASDKTDLGTLILYPQVSPPYDAVFQQIIEGIHSAQTGAVRSQALRDDATIQDILIWLDGQPERKIIALGRRGYQVAAALYDHESASSRTVVVGAVPIQPNSLAGISLMADPSALFQSLKTLAPDIRRVTVLYHSSNNWLIDLARHQALQHGLELLAEEVEDVSAAWNQYEKIIQQLDRRTDALWLPTDRVSAHSALVPRLLQESWKNNLVLFSSNPQHAQRGALFSLFPNNQALGVGLANMLDDIHHRQGRAEVRPISTMQLAVNLRTASHLGFVYSTQQRRQFDLTFHN